VNETETEEKIVALIRATEAEYRAELRAIPGCARTSKNWEYAHAVHKASMCAVLAARIERGEHR
jgi:hypothetical protein